MEICPRIYREWMEKTQEEKIRKILRRVEARGKILDIGAGTGTLEKFIEAVAVDINEEHLKSMHTKFKIKASGDALPFKNESFDFVFCIDTVHLLKNHEDMTRVLKKEGVLVISIFCYEQNLKLKSEWLRKIVDKLGLKIEEEFVVKAEKEWDFVVIAKKP